MENLKNSYLSRSAKVDTDIEILEQKWNEQNKTNEIRYDAVRKQRIPFRRHDNRYPVNNTLTKKGNKFKKIKDPH